MRTKEEILALIEEKTERKNAIENNEVDNEYDDMLDECYEHPKIAGIEFYPSNILKECDPVAYRCYSSDYFDEELSQLESYLKDLQEELKEVKE